MTKDLLKKRIDKIVTNYQNLMNFSDSLTALGLCSEDGKAFDLTWKMFDDLLDEVDDSEAISWYIFDNSCGKAKKNFFFGDKKSKVTNTKQLANQIWENYYKDKKSY